MKLLHFNREDKQLSVIFLFTILLGKIFSGLAFFIFLPFIIFLMKKRRFADLLISLIFMIILSDNITAFSYGYYIKIISILLISFYLIVTYNQHQIKPTYPKAFILFFFFALVSLVNSPMPFQAFQKTISYLLLLWAGPTLVILSFREEGGSILRKILLFLTYLLSISLVLAVINPEFVYMTGRFRGILRNPNGLGLLLFISGMFIFYIFNSRYYHLFTKKDWLVIFFIYLASLLLCNSRSSIFSLITLPILYKLRMNYKITAVLVIMLGFSFQVLISHAGDFLAIFGLEEYFRAETLEEAGGRIIGFDYAWQKITENIYLLGGGFEYTNYLFWQAFGELAAQNHVGNAHNSFLTAWIDTGVFGLVSFITAWFFMFRKAEKNYGRIYPAMFSVFLSAFFESWLIGSLNPFTIMLIIFLTTFQNIAPHQDRSGNKKMNGISF